MCQFYIVQEQAYSGRGTARERWLERCSALGVQLKVAAVTVNGPIGLVSAVVYDELTKTAGAYIFGSPARYFDREGSVQECDYYQRKEPL
jgi:hypothetical protein